MSGVRGLVSASVPITPPRLGRWRSALAARVEVTPPRASGVGAVVWRLVWSRRQPPRAQCALIAKLSWCVWLEGCQGQGGLSGRPPDHRRRGPLSFLVQTWLQVGGGRMNTQRSITTAHHNTASGTHTLPLSPHHPKQPSCVAGQHSSWQQASSSRLSGITTRTTIS